MIAETVIWGVIWFFAGSIGAGILVFSFLGLGSLIGAAIDRKWPAVVGVFVGWIGAIIWEIFVIVQVVLHAIRLFELIAAGA